MNIPSTVITSIVGLSCIAGAVINGGSLAEQGCAAQSSEPPATQPQDPPATQPDQPPGRPPFPPDRPTLPEPRSPEIPDLVARRMIRNIEQAHGKQAWLQHKAFRAELSVVYQGSKVIDAEMSFEPGTGRSRLDLLDGTILVFDGETVWQSPKDAEVEMARFHALTWPYFLAAPFKLSDPGAKLKSEQIRLLNGQLCQTGRLTFESGTGDTPNDWYLLYEQPGTGRLGAMAYIVTYGSSVDQAEQDPHLIMYETMEQFDGVTLSTNWTFWPWSLEEGMTGNRLGEASLEEVEFFEPEEGHFDRPDNSREVKMD